MDRKHVETKGRHIKEANKEMKSAGGNLLVRLNLINHLVGFIPCQICLYFSN